LFGGGTSATGAKMALELGDTVRTHDGIDGEIVSLHEDGVAALVEINQNETSVGIINCDVDLLTLIEPPGTDPRSLPPLEKSS
jgi:preprotein translocase subunit YajC